MTRLLDYRSVYNSSDGKSRVAPIPDEADEALGHPDKVVWMLDEDTGLVYIVLPEEVDLRA